MKKLLFIMCLSVSMTVFSQDIYFQSGQEDLEQKADSITNLYNRQLVLSSMHELLFEKKIEEFLIRKEKIEEQYTGKEKLDLFYSLQKNEIAEMRDILTQLQFRLYEKIRPEIQPLDTVEQ